MGISYVPEEWGGEEGLSLWTSHRQAARVY